MRIGSLFSGYGGLDLAAQQYFGGGLAWYSEIEPAACQILAAHHSITPNLGDITLVDWAEVEPVDVLTGGYPCQPFSHAGKRKGSSDERHLWPFVATAIDALRPGIVVLENVRGHLSLGFGDVIAELSRMGYDASWSVVRASDAGAPHGRARIFIVAYPDIVGRARAGSARDGRAGSSYSDEPPPDTSGHEGWISDGDSEPPTDTSGAERGGTESEYLAAASGSTTKLGERASTPSDTDGDGHGQQQDSGRVGRVDGGDAGPSRQRQRSRGIPDPRGDVSASHTSGDGRDVRPGEPDAFSGGDIGRVGRTDASPVGDGGGPAGVLPDWGKYGVAINRWELVLGRAAPDPTIVGGNGRPRLNPIFVEWMMGLDLGHVTGHGLRPAQELKALGNGVCPQQAHLALQMILGEAS